MKDRTDLTPALPFCLLRLAGSAYRGSKIRAGDLNFASSFVFTFARELEMIRRTGHAEHHSIESIVIVKGAKDRQAEPFRIETYDVIKVVRWSCDT